MEALMVGSDIPFIKEENVCEDDPSFCLSDLVIDESAELTLKNEITEELPDCAQTSFANTDLTTVIEEVAKIEEGTRELDKDIYYSSNTMNETRDSTAYNTDDLSTNTETFGVPGLDNIDPIEIKPEEPGQNLTPDPAPVLLLKSSEIQKAVEQKNQFFISKQAPSTENVYNPNKVFLLAVPPATSKCGITSSNVGPNVHSNGYQKQAEMSFVRIGKQLHYLPNSAPTFPNSNVGLKQPSSKLVSILRKDIKQKANLEDFHNYYKTKPGNTTTCNDSFSDSTAMNYDKSVKLIEPSVTYSNLELQEYCDNEIIISEIKKERNEVTLGNSNLSNEPFPYSDGREELHVNDEQLLPSNLYPTDKNIDRNVNQNMKQIKMNKSSSVNENNKSSENGNNVKVNLAFNKWFKCSKCKTICVGYKSCPRKECNKSEDSTVSEKSDSEESKMKIVPKTTTVSISKVFKCFRCQCSWSNKQEYQLHLQKVCAKYSKTEKFYNCKECKTFYVGRDSCPKQKCNEKLTEKKVPQLKSVESLSVFPYKCGFCSGMFKTLDQYETHAQNSECSKKNEGLSVIDLETNRSSIGVGEKDITRDKTESEEAIRESIDKSLAETFSKHSGECFTASKDTFLTCTSIPNRYKCAFCDIHFSSIYLYKKHLTFHEPVEYPCKLCDEVFETASCLKKHMVVHEPTEHPCDLCDKVFAKACYLRKHMVTHSEDKPYVCKVCGKGFKFDSNRYEHMKIHTGVRNYVCDICGHTSINSSHLKIHIRSHTGERPYKCKQCGKAFATTSNLSKHVVIHSDKRPFKCDYCHIAFRTIDHLSRHMMKHTNTRPFLCDLCGKSFRRTCHLKRHKERIHMNVNKARACRKIKRKLRKRWK